MRYTAVAVLIAATAATVPSLAAPIDMYAHRLIVCFATHPFITAPAVLLGMSLLLSATANMQRSLPVFTAALLPPRPPALAALTSRAPTCLQSVLIPLRTPVR